VARTLNPESHALRRDEFVDVAQRLIQTEGYEQMSVQDVLDALDTSKGAFYHYFDSKAALLEAVIDRLIDAGVARLEPSVADPDRTAVQKFEAFFGDIAEYKAEQRELIFGFMRVWLSDDNTVVREHLRRGVVGRIEPVMATIVRQGVTEGVFTVTSPEATARVLISLLQGLNEDVTGLFLALDAGSIPLEYLQLRLDAYTEALERILGVRRGTLTLADNSLIRDWQEWLNDYRKDHP
jgi:AcrR family transcriptional regulator